MVNNAAEAYKRQQIMTATPEALTLMLYNGCLKFMNEGKEAIEAKQYENERLRLARKALRGIEGISASNFEFTLPRPSYTWNTLQALSKTYPDRSFTLIIGGDNWTLFDRWYHADDIRLHYPIVVYPRPGYLPAPHLSADSQLTLPPVTMVDCPLFDVSSTEIRQRARQGDSLEGLVPDPIIDDVKQLYQ